MRKINLFLFLSLLSLAGIAQKTILVNGGKYGDPNERVNVLIYNTQTKTSTVIDTIKTGSVQDILIDGNEAYVVAQDSIVKYDLSSETRVASASFNGLSTKALAIAGNELLVSNWYGKTSDNLYIYNKTNLNLVDSISDANLAVSSILVNSSYAYINQNASNSSYQDTLGSILKIDIQNRTILDTITVSNYTQDIGEFVLNPNGLGFYAINSGSNTITTVDFATDTTTNTSLNQDFKVGGKSHISLFNDTAFIRMNQGVGAINLRNLSVIDSLIVDTVVTAFTYDTVSNVFYVTQTDFYSYNQGAIYDRAGFKTDTFKVGFSPEVIRMYYDQTVGFTDIAVKQQLFGLYPNPASSMVSINTDIELAKDAIVYVYDQKGSLVSSERLQSDMHKVNVSGLERGMYFIRLVSGQKSFTHKLILQ